MSTNPTPGWYEDTNAGVLRWWDGVAWTEHTSPLAGAQTHQTGTQSAEAYGMRVSVQDSAILVEATNLLARGALGGRGRTTVALVDVIEMNMTPPTLLANGSLKILTRGGETSVPFRRKHADSMRELYETAVARVGEAREGRRTDSVPNREHEVHRGRPRQGGNAAERTPARPQGRPVTPWGRANVYQNVAGESHYRRGLLRIARNHGVKVQERGEQLDDLRAALVADTSNPFDPNAVAVWVEEEHVGYLPRDVAAVYSPTLQDLAERDEHLVVNARLWVAAGDSDRVWANVSVWLPPANGVQSFNEPPETPYRVIPAGNAIQVTGEENHMDVLAAYLAEGERYLAVTLHVIEEQKTAKSQPYACVEVRLDGKRVGVLTKAMSEKVADLVTFIAGTGRLPVCRAVLKGSPLRAEITLYVAKSHEVTRRWMEGVEEAGP